MWRAKGIRLTARFPTEILIFRVASMPAASGAPLSPSSPNRSVVASLCQCHQLWSPPSFPRRPPSSMSQVSALKRRAAETLRSSGLALGTAPGNGRARLSPRGAPGGILVTQVFPGAGLRGKPSCSGGLSHAFPCGWLACLFAWERVSTGFSPRAPLGYVARSLVMLRCRPLARSGVVLAQAHSTCWTLPKVLGSVSSISS